MDLLAVLGEEWTPGTLIAERFGVSRQAVLRVAKRLATLGYPVERSRRGYRLAPGSPSPANVEPKLRGRFGRPYRYLPAVSSTQDALRELAEAGAPEGAVVVAERQTAGRGRRGRRWESPGGGLYLSVLLRPRIPLERLPLVPLAAGVAVARAAGVGGLKWPNDLVALVGGSWRKLGGVLLEAEILGEELKYVLLGVGLNVAEEELPEGAAGLRRFFPEARRDELLVRVLAELERAYPLLSDPDHLLELYALHSATLLRRVEARWLSGPVSGVAVGLDAGGALLVRQPGGRRKRVTAGEVSLVEATKEVGR